MVGFLTVKVEGYIQQEKEARMILALKDSAGDNRTKSYLPLQMLHREMIPDVYTYMCMYIYTCVCSVAQLYLTLCDPMHWSPSGPLSMEFSSQGYWSGLPFPPSGDLSNPGREPMSLVCPALADGFSTTAPPENLIYGLIYAYKFPC